MRTLWILLSGAVALAAAYGTNWGNGLYRDRDTFFSQISADGLSFKDLLSGNFVDDRSTYDIKNKRFGEGYTGDKSFTKDHVGTDKFEYNGDLESAIKNDKDILRKQKFILDVMRNIYTTSFFPDVKDVRVVEGESKYNNFESVVPFFKMYKTNFFITRGTTFSISDIVHRNQAIALFNLFFYSKDFSVFQQNVLWARNSVSEDMFIYVLTAAIFHRPDTIALKIPSYYEIAPHKFHTGLTLTNAINQRMNNIHDNIVIVRNNYTSDIVIMNEDSKLAYFTEDIAWNQFHFYLYLTYPFWLGADDFGLHTQRRGEFLLNALQQLTARYYLERLSNGLGEIEELSFNVPVKTGYNSFLRNFNGFGYSVRKNYYDVYTTGDYYSMARVYDFESRIRDAIDKGYAIGKDGSKIDLNNANGLDILGNLIQSNKDSVNDRYYGGLIRLMRTLFGGGQTKNVDYKNVLTSVTENYETAFRDPVTYQIYKRVLKLFYQYTNYLHPYTAEDLLLKGVRVLDVHTTRIATYFDKFDVDVSSIINKDIQLKADNDNEDKLVFVRHTRLNHKPFTINIDVDSERAQKIVVRIFLGPKFDQFGRKISINKNRENFVALDKFVYNIPAGRVTIKRATREFTFISRDRTSYVDLYKKILVNNDLNQLLELNVAENHCGFPDRLLLPRGWVSGLPMQLFVIITPAKDTAQGSPIYFRSNCDRQATSMDDYQLGFPFNRHIHQADFHVPNMFFKDIFIYHEGEDVNVGYDRNLGFKNFIGFNDFDRKHQLTGVRNFADDQLLRTDRLV